MPSQPLTWDSGHWLPVAPIQNISAVFTPAALDALKADIVALAPQFPALVTLTDDECQLLQRVGAGRETFCDTAITGAATFPTVMPAYLSKTKWDKDELYFDQLGEVEVALAAQLQKVRDTRAVVGAERYRQARKFYKIVKTAKEDVVSLQSLYDTLSEQFEGQGGAVSRPRRRQTAEARSRRRNR